MCSGKSARFRWRTKFRKFSLSSIHCSIFCCDSPQAGSVFISRFERLRSTSRSMAKRVSSTLTWWKRFLSTRSSSRSSCSKSSSVDGTRSPLFLLLIPVRRSSPRSPSLLPTDTLRHFVCLQGDASGFKREFRTTPGIALASLAWSRFIFDFRTVYDVLCFVQEYMFGAHRADGRWRTGCV